MDIPTASHQAIGFSRSTLIKLILNGLNSKKIPYVVLRNFEEVLEEREKDIDLLLPPSMFRRAVNVVKSATLATGEWKIVNIRADLKDCYVTIATPRMLSSDPCPTEFRPILFQLSPFYTTRGDNGQKLRVSCAEIDTMSIAWGETKVRLPSPCWQAYLYLAQHTNRGQSKYIDKFDQIIREEHIDITALHSEAASSLPSPDAMLRHINGKPLSQSRSALLKLRSLINFVTLNFMHRGITITFSGPDGAGKTTSKEAATTFLQETLKTRVVSLRELAPINNVLKKQLNRLQEIIRGVPNTGEEAQTRYRDRPPARSKERGFWKMRRAFGLIFYLLQYHLGYVIARVRNMAGVTVVVDTSVFDRFVKSHRPRFPWIERFSLPLLPKGDAIFLLTAAPERIHDRKPELSEDEIQYYYIRMNEILDPPNNENKVVVVRTDSSPQLSRSQVLNKVLSNL